MKPDRNGLSVITSIALRILSTGQAGAAVRQLPRPGEFLIVTSGDGTRAWRINTLTGAMLYCIPEEDSEVPICKRVEVPAQPGQGSAQREY
jgi:hypothetical protein